MPSAQGEPPHTSTSVALGKAALAAGAVIAGLALGRKRPLPLAAGLAAAASLRLLSKAKHHGEPESPSAKNILEQRRNASDDLPPVADWVDSKSVLEPFVSPGAVHLPPPVMHSSAGGTPAFPLLDDLGQLVQEPEREDSPTPDATCAAGDAAEFGFSLGPLIWEPGQEVVSYSESHGETVWFGLRDTPVEQLESKPAPQSTPVPAPVSLAEPLPTVPLQVVPTTGPETVASIMDSLRAEAGLTAGTPDPTSEAPVPGPPSMGQNPGGPTGAFPTPFPPAPEKALPTMFQAAGPQGLPAGQMPFLPSTDTVPAVAPEGMSFADWMLASQLNISAQPTTTQIVPKSMGATALPAPRRLGESPRAAGDGPQPTAPSTSPDQTHSATSTSTKLPSRRTSPTPRAAHRSVSPMAPSKLVAPRTHRPLAFMILAVLLLAIAAAAVVWRNGGWIANAKDADHPWSPQQTLEKQVQ